MAWRDTRRQRGKLLLFACSVVFGVGALVAISSFRINLQEETQRKAKELLGADVVFRSRQPFTPESQAAMASLGPSERASEISFSTMAYFPEPDATRLVIARGMEGPFPWYGEMETDPPGAAVAGAEEPIAIIDDSLRAQFGVGVGDTVKLGAQEFRIVATLLKMPGDSVMAGTFAPRVLIPRAFVQATNLVQFGSRVDYKQLYKFEGGWTEALDKQLNEMRPDLREEGVRDTTVEERGEDIQRNLDRMADFLNLVGFIALLLGGVGIAGAVHAYLKEKVDTVAVLRCLGASARSSLLVFALQVSCTGLVGATLGAVVGLGIQTLLPDVLEPFLPFDIEMRIPWNAALLSLGLGWLFTTLFSFLPLLPVRRVTPLLALRSSVEARGKARRDPLALLTVGLILALTVAFATTQSSDPRNGYFFVAGLAVAIVTLAGAGTLLRAGLRKISAAGLPFSTRQGLMNLYRPNNRTVFLTVTLGVGTFLIYTLYLSERGLLEQGDLSDQEEEANLLLFDIQPDQREGVARIMRESGVEPQLQEPIVTMRLSEINGEPVAGMQNHRGQDIERWAARREYRSTYRDHIRPDEILLEGEFVEQASLDSGEPVPVSVEDRIIEALNLRIGDRMTWDVQGVPVESVVRSVREVDWRQMKPNFFVVFPAGVLEAAPATFITSARVESDEVKAKLQRDIVRAYPNVSAINLDVIIESLRSVFDKIAFVIRFMASFTIVTGLIALVSTIVTSRYQRVKESVLLRTLGSSGGQVRSIMMVEYAALGLMASVSGVLLAVAAGWSLAVFMFEVEFVMPWATTGLMVLAVCILTLVTGLANSVGIASHPPLETLRKEG